MNDLTRRIEDVLGLDERTLLQIGTSLVIILILLIINRVLNRVAVKIGTEARSVFRIRKGISYATGLLAVVLVAGVWLESMGTLTTFLGLLTAGIAISLKDVIEDVAGWIFIMARKPFTLEDRIESMGTKGDVIDIRIFKTSLLEVGNWVEADQSTGRIVHLPNKFVFTQTIANYSKGFQYIWNEIKVLITFESDWERAKHLLTETVKRHGEIPDAVARKALKEAGGRYLISYNIMTPAVYTSVKDSGILLTLRYLCKPRERRRTEEDIWEDVLRMISREKNIALAYPTTRFYKEGEGGRPREDPPGPAAD